MTMIQIQNVIFAYGDREIIRWEGTYQLDDGDRIGIVGRNGSGKTTLLKLLYGEMAPDSGIVRVRTDFALIRQQEDEDRRADTESYEAAAPSRMLGTLRKEDTHSGGERMRARIAAELAKQSPILFADEPASHLDLDGILQLQAELQDYRGAVILISHDRDLLDAVCTSILEVEDGKVTEYRGNYTDYREQKRLAVLSAEREYGQYRTEKARLEEAARRKAEQAGRIKDKPKRMSDKEARLGKAKVQNARAKVMRASHAIESRLDQLEVKDRPYTPDPVLFDIRAHAPINGKTVLRAERVTKAGDNGKPLFDNLSFVLTPGTKVALIGPNGSGKTTLLRLLAEGGEGLYKSPGCMIGMFSQQSEHLDNEQTIFQTVSQNSRYAESDIRLSLARLGFRKETVFRQVGSLSGGEKVRTAIAQLLFGEFNLLLLDEPTNYLDAEAREQIETTLSAYPGTIVFATHDRRLARSVASHTLELRSGSARFREGTPFES